MRCCLLCLYTGDRQLGQGQGQGKYAAPSDSYVCPVGHEVGGRGGDRQGPVRKVCSVVDGFAEVCDCIANGHLMANKSEKYS